MSVPAHLVQQVMQAQQAGQGGMLIPDILTSQEQAFMQQAWPRIRVAAKFTDINWGAIGLPDPPPLSPVAYAAMQYVWPQVRVAADFSHPRWELHPVPINVLAAAMPIPEAPPETPVPQTPVTTEAPAPPAPPTVLYPAIPPVLSIPTSSFTPPAMTGGGSSNTPAPQEPPVYYDPISREPIEEDAAETGAPVPVQTASIFGKLNWPLMIALTVGGFLLFGKPKLPGRSGGRRRRRRR